MPQDSVILDASQDTTSSLHTFQLQEAIKPLVAGCLTEASISAASSQMVQGTWAGLALAENVKPVPYPCVRSNAPADAS